MTSNNYEECSIDGSGSIKKDRFSFSRRMMPSLNLWKWVPVIGAILLD